jgi:hypothetical protein
MQEGRQYDLVISDLNFREAGFGGPRDGFKVLRYVKAQQPDAEVLLFTAYGPTVIGPEAVAFAQDVELRKGAWVEFDLRSEDQGWGPVRTTVRVLLNLIDQRREMQRLMRDEDRLPELYRVILRYRDEDGDLDPQTNFASGPLIVEITPAGSEGAEMRNAKCEMRNDRKREMRNVKCEMTGTPDSGQSAIRNPQSAIRTVAIELQKNQSRLFQFLARDANVRRVHSSQLILRQLNAARTQETYRKLPAEAQERIVEWLRVGCIRAGIPPSQCDFYGQGIARPGRMGYECSRQLGVCIRETYERRVVTVDAAAELSPASFTGCVREIREHLRAGDPSYEDLLVNRRGYGYGLAARVEWKRVG